MEVRNQVLPKNRSWGSMSLEMLGSKFPAPRTLPEPSLRPSWLHRVLWGRHSVSGETMVGPTVRWQEWHSGASEGPCVASR